MSENGNGEVCVECGITFDPLPWADPLDPICDECIEASLVADSLTEPWR